MFGVPESDARGTQTSPSYVLNTGATASNAGASALMSIIAVVACQASIEAQVAAALLRQAISTAQSLVQGRVANQTVRVPYICNDDFGDQYIGREVVGSAEKSVTPSVTESK